MDQSTEIGTTGSEQPGEIRRRAVELILLVLAGLALAVACRLVVPRVAFGPRFDQILIFAAGAAAAVLVLRLMVQRERRVALQLVVSEIVGRSTTPEIAAMRVLEALCVSQGWDVALRWEVNDEKNQLEFCSAWGAPGRRAEILIRESTGQVLASEVDLIGRVWRDGLPAWIPDLSSLPLSPRAQAARRHGMVSGCAIPVHVGNRVMAVLEFYCHFCLRENREAMAAVETVATSLGQMLVGSHERIRAEKLYRQQQILLDTVADGICGLDSNGLVSFANPAAARLLGASSSGLIGQPVHALLHGSAPSGTQCAEDCTLLRAAGEQVVTSGEDTIFRIDGSSFQVDYALTPILDDHHFSGSVLSFHDISQRYAVDRLKDEFISTVSHELRTPLTSIRGALGLLSVIIQEQMNEKASNLLRIALANSDRLMSLINDILDLERLRSGLEPLAFHPIQLGQIVRQAVDGIQPLADDAGVQLIYDTTQAEITANAGRLLQVLTNLLSNAVKFSPPQSTVFIMLRPDVSGVTLSVVDNGRGIPADKLETVFGRFQQVDASDSRQKGGTGLGLAICRTIVEQHSGRIWAERNPVRGSTFRVFVPYQPAAFKSTGTSPESETGPGTVISAHVDPGPQPPAEAAGHLIN